MFKPKVISPKVYKMFQERTDMQIQNPSDSFTNTRLKTKLKNGKNGNLVKPLRIVRRKVGLDCKRTKSTSALLSSHKVLPSLGVSEDYIHTVEDPVSQMTLLNEDSIHEASLPEMENYIPNIDKQPLEKSLTVSSFPCIRKGNEF